MSWDLKFPEPISVPDGEPLVTLRDAGDYITTLPLKVLDGRAWQAAMHVLIQAADDGGPIEFARLGMLQALHPKPALLHRPSSHGAAWRNNYTLVRDR